MDTDEGTNVSIPRGGPIFVPKLTSCLTSIPDFEHAIFHELRELKAELQSEELSDADEEDISVDELKVFTDEELISEAMKEAFKEEEHSSQREEKSTSSTVSKKRSSTSRAISKKKRVIPRQDSNFEKVEELAKIRQRQKEDRAAARLHSLNKHNKRSATSSDSSERVKCLESIRCPTKIKPTNTREHVNIRDPEVFLCIEVYSNKNPSLKTQEIMVLGQQKLTELRDSIHCMTDVIMRKANQHDPSGYFLIEDVFCNDMRDPSAIDYSKPILDWLKNSKEEALAKWEYITYCESKSNRKALLGAKNKAHLPHFKAVEMQKMSFRDLKFYVGARYTYCHQGDCKHDIVIREMRLVHPEDYRNRAAYPLVGFQNKFRVQKCSVCQIFKATHMTDNDMWAGENPCYFCDNCYLMLHYDENANLRYDHVVHDFIQDM